MDNKVPELSIELIERLNENFPVYQPKPGDSLDKIMYKAGQRSVIDMLLARTKKEELIDVR